jgi:hypothetical protein
VFGTLLGPEESGPDGFPLSFGGPGCGLVVLVAPFLRGHPLVWGGGRGLVGGVFEKWIVDASI